MLPLDIVNYIFSYTQECIECFKVNYRFCCICEDSVCKDCVQTCRCGHYVCYIDTFVCGCCKQHFCHDCLYDYDFLNIECWCIECYIFVIINN